MIFLFNPSVGVISSVCTEVYLSKNALASIYRGLSTREWKDATEKCARVTAELLIPLGLLSTIGSQNSAKNFLQKIPLALGVAKLTSGPLIRLLGNKSNNEDPQVESNESDTRQSSRNIVIKRGSKAVLAGLAFTGALHILYRAKGLVASLR